MATAASIMSSATGVFGCNQFPCRDDCAIASSALRNRLTRTCWICTMRTCNGNATESSSPGPTFGGPLLTFSRDCRGRLPGQIAAGDGSGLGRVHCSPRLQSSRCSREKKNLLRRPAALDPSCRRASARHCSGNRDPGTMRTARIAQTRRMLEPSTSKMRQQVFCSSS
jgi:hypothetical protein